MKTQIRMGILISALLLLCGTPARISAEETVYHDYRQAYAAEPMGKEAVSKEKEYLLTKENPRAVYDLAIPSDGLYEITVDYAQTEDAVRDMKIELDVNGELPFREAKEIELPRIYEDASGIRVDANGNEIAPKQKMVLSWQRHTLISTTGYETRPYVFYLEKGTNRFTITGNGVEIRLKGITAAPQREIPPYEEYLARRPGTDTRGIFVKIQAEKAKWKTTSMLYPTYDRNNAGTESADGTLNSPKKIRINAAGGEMWKQSGQWITWEFEVPEDGYYNLGFKFRQKYSEGIYTSRNILIDGEVPFAEMMGVRFRYDDVWQTMPLADGNGDPYRIYLEAGKHEIKMEACMGDLAESVRTVDEAVQSLNDLYLKIIMVTGTSPDPYTDYFLERSIDGLKESLETNQKLLEQELDRIVELTNGRGNATSSIDTMQIQLKTFLEDPEEIPKRLSAFKNNISALGTWVVDMQEQALQLDYLYVKSPDQPEPEAESGFLKRALYSVRRFLASFDDSNNSVQTTESGEKQRTITVWLNSTVAQTDGSGAPNTTSAGRDQAQVIRDMIDEMFTPDTGINVELMLVQGSLIEATLAGTGPDVALFTAEDQPVNYAMRGAVEDLSKMEGFDEVRKRFYDSAVVPFEFEGGCYALPDTQIFNTLFYRTDVFETLGIEPPSTWEEFYDILPIIQRNNFQITPQDIFPTLLFQNGGSYYNSDDTRAMFDSREAIEAMKTYTSLYVMDGFEVKTDFYSRFRSGEIVMSIQPYNMYNQLVAAAPEINGRWAMVRIPGTPKDGGTIDRSESSVLTGSVMLRTTKDKDAAWEFMKWWSSDEVKARYANQIEGLLGGSARFTPANIHALELLPWEEAPLRNLQESMAECKPVPQIPGSYYTQRALTNAFRSVVYNGDVPREALREQNEMINYEITRKRKEFGLPVGEDGEGS